MATVATLPNIAALRALSEPTAPDAISLRGYADRFDGGEGVFCNSGKAGTDDNGGTIIVDAAQRVWIRKTSGAPYNVKWFGATGNGAVDDTTSIQNAIDAVQVAKTHRPLLIIPAGVYLTSSPLVIRATIRLSGAGRFNTYVVASNPIADVIQIMGDPVVDRYLVVEISDLQLHATTQKVAGYGIRVSTTNGCPCRYHYYHDLFMSANMFGGTYVEAGADLTLANITISSVGKNASGFLFAGSSRSPLSNIRMKDCHVETGVASQTTTGLLIDAHVRGLYASCCSMRGGNSREDLSIGLNRGVYITNSSGPSNRPANLFFDHLVCDGIRGDACRIEAVKHGVFESCSFSGSVQSHGVHLPGNAPGGCHGVSLHNCVITDNALSGVNILSGARDTKIMGSAFDNNGATEAGHAGIAVQKSATHFTIMGNSFGSRETTGVRIGAGCDWFIVSANDFHCAPNAIVNESVDSAHSVVANNLHQA